MFSYRPSFIPRNIILIGGGGTGSRLIPGLVQLVRSHIRQFNPNGWLIQVPIYIFDDDIVEEKNLARQNFAPPDVGRPKALVLADRYSNAYGIPVIPVLEKFGETAMRKTVPNGAGTQVAAGHILANSIIISAVDSAQARRDILKTLFYYLGAGTNIDQSNDFFFVDAGNEDDFGQIKFFTNYVVGKGVTTVEAALKRFPEQIPVEYQVPGIPIDFDYYTNLGSSAQELSCADLPQTLAINQMMAALMLGVIQNFIQSRPMSFDGQRYSLKGGMSVERNNIRRWFSRALDSLPGWTGRSIDYVNFRLDQKTSGTILGDYWLAISKSYQESGMILNMDGSLTPMPLKEEKPAAKPVAPAKSKVKKVAKPADVTAETVTAEALQELLVEAQEVFQNVPALERL